MDATFSTWIIEMCVINSSHKSIQISVNSFFVGITCNRVRTEDCRLTEKKNVKEEKKLVPEKCQNNETTHTKIKNNDVHWCSHFRKSNEICDWLPPVAPIVKRTELYDSYTHTLIINHFLQFSFNAISSEMLLHVISTSIIKDCQWTFALSQHHSIRSILEIHFR